MGRLNDAPDKMRKSPQSLSPTGKLKLYKCQRVNRKPKGFKSTYPGQYVSMDTIERRRGTLKRYVMRFIDPKTSFAFAAGVPENNSLYASHVFTGHIKATYSIKTLLSNNGSEFKGQFSPLLEQPG